jgi:antitoxin PrlF
MPSSTVTSKGQITIPAEIRRDLGLHTGSRIDFVWNEQGGLEIRVKAGSIKDLKGIVPRPERPVTLEEMDDAIAAGANG